MLFRFEDKKTGNVYEIEGPEGATESDAWQVLQQRLDSGAATGTEKGSQEAPAGFVQGLRDPVDAAAQLLEKSLPGGVVNKVNEFNDWLVDLGVPLQRMGEEGLTRSLQDNEDAYRQRRALEGDTGMDLDRLAGNILSPVNVIPGALATRAATGAGRLGQAVGIGAGTGAISQPVLDDDYLTGLVKNAAFGALGGALVEPLAMGFNKIGSQANRPDITRLREMGVTPTIGQIIGDGASRAEQKLTSLPILGDAISHARGKALNQFNTGAINEAVEPALYQGMLHPQGRSHQPVATQGQEGVAQANDIVKEAYRLGESVVDDVVIDGQAFSEIAALQRGLASKPIDAETTVNRFIKGDLMRRADSSGVINDFGRLESEIGAKIRASQGETKDQLIQLRDIIRGAVARHNPEYAAIKKAADTAFAHMVRVNDASGVAALQEGIFSPGQLIRAAKNAKNDKSAGKRAGATGEALMQSTGQLGQRVLGDTVPNSGTFDRMLMGLGTGAGAFAVDPMALASILAGSALYTAPAQAALTGMASRAGKLPVSFPPAVGGYLGAEVGRSKFRE